MKYLLSKKMQIVSIMVFLLGLTTFSLSYYSTGYAKRSGPPKGLTMVSRQVFTPRDGGESILFAISVRYQKQDGNWKLVNTYYRPDGTVRNTDSGFGELGRGVFQVDDRNKQLNFLSSMEKESQGLEELAAHEQALRSDPRFAKQDRVLGYKTLVLRHSGQDESEYTDIYYAPDFRGIALKHVIVSKAGVETIEPLSIEVGEPGAAVFSSMPDYPVNYDRFNKKIEAVQKTGDADAAKGLHNQLRQQQSKSQR